MRKKLLSEAQVRRFQSLASIKPLNEMDSSYKKHDDEDKMEEAYGDAAHKKDDEAHMKDDAMEEAMHEDEAAMKDDMDEALYEEEEDMDDEKMADADVELDEELVEEFMDAVKTIQQVADSLGGAAGGEMDLAGDEPADDMDLGGDEPADDMDMGGDEDEGDEEMLQEALRGIQYVPSQKEIVKTVARRVAKRLQEAKRAEARLNRALGKRR